MLRPHLGQRCVLRSVQCAQQRIHRHPEVLRCLPDLSCEPSQVLEAGSGGHGFGANQHAEITGVLFDALTCIMVTPTLVQSPHATAELSECTVRCLVPISRSPSSFRVKTGQWATTAIVRAVIVDHGTLVSKCSYLCTIIFVKA